jgi:hypothetical protein
MEKLLKKVGDRVANGLTASRHFIKKAGTIANRWRRPDAS